MNQSVIIIASFAPKDGKEQEVENMLRVMASSSRSEAGCTCYDLYCSESSNSFTLFECYRDQVAVEEHLQTEHFKNFRAQISELLKESPQVNILRGVDVAKR
jgi:quinol monooxygenase YgiN